MTDLVTAVLASAESRGSARALTFGTTTLTSAELAHRIRATASALRASGMQHGDRVLFSVRPGPDAVVLALAIVLARGTVVFADPGAGEALFRARAALAAPKWVAAESLLYLASSAPLRSLARKRGLELAPYAKLIPDATYIRSGAWLPGVPRSLSVARLAKHPITECPEGALEDEALVVFTSGTTDAPKAVVHSRGSLGAGLADFAAGVGIQPGQRVLTDQLMVGIPALIAGAHWVLPPRGANPGAGPAQYLGLLPEAEVLFAVPATMSSLLGAIDADPALAPPRLATIVLGGAPVLQPLLERIVARFPDATVRAVYGMTEILPVAIADGAEKLARLRAGGVEGDPVGQVVPSVSARLDEGELVLSGAGLARGYLAELPSNPLTHLRTGDLATLGTDGALTLLGRKKDMFIRGTQNVYPGLYEPVITGLDGVADAVLTGVPNAIGDDAIVLIIVPESDAPESLTAAHPLALRVERALPGLIDSGGLPDHVLVAPALPRAGRSRKLDRSAVASQARAFLAGAP